MDKILNDKQALKIINHLIKFEFTNEEESSSMLIMLENYITGLADVITQEKLSLSPDEMLILARKRNKLIYL